jgi:hypothetical protein
MRQYGDVLECRGEVDFTGDRPVCRERSSREIQLVAGEQRAHRLVVVKPRGDAAEFALVYVRTRS